MTPLATPPFGAFDCTTENSIYAAFTLGGLHTDVDGRVLDPAGDAIPGLFAAGRCTSGLSVGGYSSGLSLGDGTFFGRRAGATAAGRAILSEARPRERLPRSLLFLYGAPSFAGAAMLVPIYIHLPKFYSDVVGVPLGFLAIAIAAARALDALSDPFVGWLSDRSRTRWGRRRPFIALGAPLCAIAFYALFAPPDSLTMRAASTWFTATFVLYFVFHTLYALPHYALGPELTLDYHERSRLFGYREGFSILGTVIAAAAPGLLVSAGGMTRPPRIRRARRRVRNHAHRGVAAAGGTRARAPRLRRAPVESLRAGRAARAAQSAVPHPARHLRGGERGRRDSRHLHAVLQRLRDPSRQRSRLARRLPGRVLRCRLPVPAGVDVGGAALRQEAGPGSRASSSASPAAPACSSSSRATRCRRSS